MNDKLTKEQKHRLDQVKRDRQADIKAQFDAFLQTL